MSNQKIAADDDREWLAHHRRMVALDATEPSLATDSAILTYAKNKLKAPSTHSGRRKSWLPVSVGAAAIAGLSLAGALYWQQWQQPDHPAALDKPIVAPIRALVPVAVDTPVVTTAPVASRPTVANPASPSRWVAGQHYQVLQKAQSTAVAAGKIEVLEMFDYGCPHCYELDRFILSWQRNLAFDVSFSRVPVTWGPAQRARAQLYYTLQTFPEFSALHERVFEAIYLSKSPLAGANDDETLQLQQKFAAFYGLDPQAYANAFTSPSVQAQLAAAAEIATRYKIQGVPEIVVNGKYLTNVGMAGSQENLVEVINTLVSLERKHSIDLVLP